MTQYREILRLYQHGISQRSIALSCKCSRNTVAAVVQRAKTANLQWPLDEKTDAELETLLFPEKQKQTSSRRMPDFEKVAKELSRNGVTLKLLWMEYCEECRQTRQQPFMYSQFCYHFQQYAQQERATMLSRGNREIVSKWTGLETSCISWIGIPVRQFRLICSSVSFHSACMRMLRLVPVWIWKAGSMLMSICSAISAVQRLCWCRIISRPA